MLPRKVRDDISLYAGGVVAVINAIQIVAVPWPAWAQAAFAVVSGVAGALITWANVTPVERPVSSPQTIRDQAAQQE